MQVDDLGEDCLISAAKTCMSSKLIGADSGTQIIILVIFFFLVLQAKNEDEFRLLLRIFEGDTVRNDYSV